MDGERAAADAGLDVGEVALAGGHLRPDPFGVVRVAARLGGAVASGDGFLLGQPGGARGGAVPGGGVSPPAHRGGPPAAAAAFLGRLPADAAAGVAAFQDLDLEGAA